MRQEAILGYHIRHATTKQPAPLNRICYDSKQAASNGFNYWTKTHAPYSNLYEHLSKVKFKNQDEYELVHLIVYEDIGQ